MSNKKQLKISLTENGLRLRFHDERDVPSDRVTWITGTYGHSKAEHLLEEMAENNEAGWDKDESAGTYYIADEDAAKEFVDSNGGNVPYGL